MEKTPFEREKKEQKLKTNVKPINNTQEHK
jgi:hypothetical protein